MGNLSNHQFWISQFLKSQNQSGKQKTKICPIWPHWEDKKIQWMTTFPVSYPPLPIPCPPLTHCVGFTLILWGGLTSCWNCVKCFRETNSSPSWCPLLASWVFWGNFHLGAHCFNSPRVRLRDESVSLQSPHFCQACYTSYKRLQQVSIFLFSYFPQL